jgi:hypothetical protein
MTAEETLEVKWKRGEGLRHGKGDRTRGYVYKWERNKHEIGYCICTVDRH